MMIVRSMSERVWRKEDGCELLNPALFDAAQRHAHAVTRPAQAAKGVRSQHQHNDVMPSAPVRLFLVRHGEVGANVELRYLGHRDDPLSERGAWQAVQLAQAFVALPVKAIYTSPLRRAADTAAEIGRVHQLPVQVDERLREAGFGNWEGATRAEVLARSPEDGALLAAWEGDPGVAPPGGESLQAIQTRVLTFVQEVAAGRPGEDIVLVSHVGPIKAILCAALQVPLTTARHLFLDPATISVVDWAAQPVVRLFNAHGHLGWESRAGWRADAAQGRIVARWSTSLVLPQCGRRSKRLNRPCIAPSRRV